MRATASQISSLTIVYSTVHSGADQRKRQRSASLAFVWGIHRSPVNSPHKRPVTRKMFPFGDVRIISRSKLRRNADSTTMITAELRSHFKLMKDVYSSWASYRLSQVNSSKKNNSFLHTSWGYELKKCTTPVALCDVNPPVNDGFLS